jgi:hypothetical protein
VVVELLLLVVVELLLLGIVRAFCVADAFF